MESFLPEVDGSKAWLADSFLTTSNYILITGFNNFMHHGLGSKAGASGVALKIQEQIESKRCLWCDEDLSGVSRNDQREHYGNCDESQGLYWVRETTDEEV